MRPLLKIANIPILLLFLIAGCSTEPEPIRFGEDKCAYCQMMIAEPNYGAELVTEKGRVYKFDAVECLVNYQAEHPKDYAHQLVTPFDAPKEYLQRLSPG